MIAVSVIPAQGPDAQMLTQVSLEIQQRLNLPRSPSLDTFIEGQVKVVFAQA